jgi:hypothetical protein
MSFFIRILLLIALAIAFMMTTGCSSLKFKNVAKTGATTAVTYAIAGPLPAIANLATSVAVDEILPEDNQVDDIKTKEQAVAYVATSWGMNVLYGFIAFLLITNVLVPFITRKWGYNEAKNKYKEVVFKQDGELK